MSFASSFSRPSFLPDNFTLSLLGVVVIASLLPASGQAAHFFEYLTTGAIGLLFFLHGIKLSREAVLDGIKHWRLHLLVFASTFALFPIVALVLKPVLSPLVTHDLYTGVLFMSALPATVQSAIAFTAIARGNMPAAICSASASTLLGVIISPLLISLIVLPHSGPTGGSPFDAIGKILLQLLLPFLVGHFMRPWVARWFKKRASAMKLVDRGSILLIVYTAFSAAVVDGLWAQIPTSALAGLFVVCAVLLAVMLCLTTWLARKLGFRFEDEIAIVFCGSKKSLASGIPLAKILFASSAVGAIVLPVMLFHQMQLMVCAILAQRYKQRGREMGVAPSTLGMS